MTPVDPRTRRGTFFGAITLVLLLGGCGKKTQECNAVVEAVNRVEAATKGEPATDAKAHAVALKGVADAEEGAAAALSKLAPTAPELGRFSTRFQAAFKENAGASRDLAALLEHVPDAAAQKALEQRIGAARDAMDRAEQNVEARCTDDAAACASFAALLKKQPDPDAIDAADPAKTKAWSEGVTAWSAELSKTEVKDGDLKRELDQLQKGSKDLAAVVVELAQISADAPKREAAHKAQEKSAKEITALIDELNQFCQAP